MGAAPQDTTRREPTIAQEEARLVAAWAAFGAALVGMRTWILALAHKATPEGLQGWQWAPLLYAEDLLVVAVSALVTLLVHRHIRSRRTRRCLRLACWAASAFGTAYAAINVEIFRYLRSPLTYRLWRLSDNLKGVRASVDAALDLERVSSLCILLLASVLTSVLVLLRWPGLVRAQRWISSGLAAVAATCILACSVVLQAAAIDRELYANPHIEFLRSWLREGDPFVSGSFEPEDLASFDPASRSIQACASSRGLWKGKNVILIVLESVGARYMPIYNPTVGTTSELSRLAAQHGVVVERFYAHAPSTSAAMAAMFCSLLPRHGWRAIPGKYPAIGVLGLGDQLSQNGYRTGIIHSGDLSFDGENHFLQNHGFQEVWDYRDLLEFAGRVRTGRGGNGQVSDRALLEATSIWLDRNHPPFFLTLWTIETHHPYLVDDAERLSDEDSLQRYLTAIQHADKLIGRLWRELDRRHLLDNTVVIVTADHGEAFWQHGHIAHGQTLFEEEIRIPLVFLSTDIPEPTRLRGIYRQIDLAPTLTGLLGLEPAPEWQGTAMCFCHPRKLPVYLFTCYNHYLFGVLQGHHKYVYDATTGRAALYDLSQDPREQRAIAPGSIPFAREAHRKLAAWLRFQNDFLEAHVPPARERRP